MAKNWAIVVGINEYENIGHLKYANRDAEAMATFFREDGFDRVFCFADGLEIPKERDQKSTQPRLTDLLSFLHDRFDLTNRAGNPLPKPLSTGDNLWFFFSGHGKRIGDRDCLLPQDYNPRISNYETWITVDFVREALLRSGADNVILLLDACRTEGEKDDGTGIGDQQPGTITIFSCERSKPAYEIDALQHGAFTAALLKGLRMPKSDKNCATVQRLDQHLRDWVPQLCQQHPEKPTQMPSTMVDPGQKWHFLLLPKVATDQDIATLKSEARGASLRGNRELAEQLWIRFGAVSPGDREAYDEYARVQQKDEALTNLNHQTLFKKPSEFPVVLQSELTSKTINQANLNISKIKSQVIIAFKLLEEQVIGISNILRASVKSGKNFKYYADFPWRIMVILGICYLPMGFLISRTEIWVLVTSWIVVWTGAIFVNLGISSEQIKDWSFQKDSSFFVTLSLGIIWAIGGAIAGGDMAVGGCIAAWPFVWSWSCLWFFSVGMIQRNEASFAWSWFAIPMALILGMLVGHFTGVGPGVGFVGAFFALIQFLGIIGMLALPNFLVSTQKQKRKSPQHNVLICGLAPSLGLIMGRLLIFLYR